MGEKTKQSTKAPLFGGRELLFSQRELLLLVGPLLVEQLLEVTVGMADTMMVSRCGEAAISGVSLVDMINNLIIVLFAALATGGAVVVSQYLGAREQKKADASSGQLILLSALLGAGVALFCFVLARPMIRLCYGSIDADVLEAGVLYLRITCSVNGLFYAAMYSFDSFALGAGSPRLVLANSLIDAFAVRFGLAFLLSGVLGAGYVGIFVAQAASPVIPAIIGGAYVRHWSRSRGASGR